MIKDYSWELQKLALILNMTSSNEYEQYNMS